MEPMGKNLKTPKYDPGFKSHSGKGSVALCPMQIGGFLLSLSASALKCCTDHSDFRTGGDVHNLR